MTRDQAVNLVIDKFERGMQPTEAELKAAGMCTECGGFGFTDYDEDGFTEIPCPKCKVKN